MNWKEERDQKRREREVKQRIRAMATPVSRGESLNVLMELQQQIVSLALAFEALDTLLIQRGVLNDNEVLDKMKEIAEKRKAEVEATDVVNQEASRIITPA